MFLMLTQNQEYRHKYKEYIQDSIYILMKELNFSYTELLDMDMDTFNGFKKRFKDDRERRTETIKEVQKNNPSHFMFTLDL